MTVALTLFHNCYKHTPVSANLLIVEGQLAILNNTGVWHDDSVPNLYVTGQHLSITVNFFFSNILFMLILHISHL